MNMAQSVSTATLLTAATAYDHPQQAPVAVPMAAENISGYWSNQLYEPTPESAHSSPGQETHTTPISMTPPPALTSPPPPALTSWPPPTAEETNFHTPSEVSPPQGSAIGSTYGTPQSAQSTFADRL